MEPQTRITVHYDSDPNAANACRTIRNDMLHQFSDVFNPTLKAPASLPHPSKHNMSHDQCLIAEFSGRHIVVAAVNEVINEYRPHLVPSERTAVRGITVESQVISRIAAHYGYTDAKQFHTEFGRVAAGMDSSRPMIGVMACLMRPAVQFAIDRFEGFDFERNAEPLELIPHTDVSKFDPAEVVQVQAGQKRRRADDIFDRALDRLTRLIHAAVTKNGTVTVAGPILEIFKFNRCSVQYQIWETSGDAVANIVIIDILRNNFNLRAATFKQLAQFLASNRVLGLVALLLLLDPTKTQPPSLGVKTMGDLTEAAVGMLASMTGGEKGLRKAFNDLIPVLATACLREWEIPVEKVTSNKRPSRGGAKPTS